MSSANKVTTTTYGSQVAKAADTFSRDGYVITSWNTKPDGSGTSYNTTDKITLNSNLTLYAIWGLRNLNVKFYPNNTAADGLVAYYPFYNDLRDYSGNNNHPNTSYGITLKTIDGKKCAYFDGKNYIRVLTSNSIKTANRNHCTVCTWCYLLSTTISKPTGKEDGNKWNNALLTKDWYSVNNTNTNTRRIFNLSISRVRKVAAAGNEGTDNTKEEITISQQDANEGTAIGKWFFMAATHQRLANGKVKVKFYLGDTGSLRLIGEREIGYIEDTGQELLIGGDPGGTLEILNGYMREARVYNKALNLNQLNYVKNLTNNNGTVNRTISKVVNYGSNISIPAEDTFLPEDNKEFKDWSTSNRSIVKAPNSTYGPITSDINFYANWKDTPIGSVNHVLIPASENTFTWTAASATSSIGSYFGGEMGLGYLFVNSTTDIVFYPTKLYDVVRRSYSNGTKMQSTNKKTTVYRIASATVSGNNRKPSGTKVTTDVAEVGLGGIILKDCTNMGNRLITKVILNPGIYCRGKHTSSKFTESFKFNSPPVTDLLMYRKCTGSGCDHYFKLAAGGGKIVATLSNGVTIIKTFGSSYGVGWSGNFSASSAIDNQLAFDFSNDLVNQPKSVYTTKIEFYSKVTSSTYALGIPITGIIFYKLG